MSAHPRAPPARAPIFSSALTTAPPPLYNHLPLCNSQGLMDPPELNPYTKISRSAVNSWEHRELAIEAARQSVVLLTNKAGVLPLPAKIPAVAVVGPNANVTAFGNYAGSNPNCSTVLSGIKAQARASGADTTVHYAQGCTVATNDTSGFAAAIAAAQAAEYTIAVFGIDQSQEHEGGTRSDIVLPGVQTELLKALRATTTKLIVVLMGGSAMAVPWLADAADALLWVGYGGEEAGAGLADVLFGAVSPAGRLPITFYTGLSQLPPFASYNMRQEPGRTFRFLTEQPLFPFGHGTVHAVPSVPLLSIRLEFEFRSTPALQFQPEPPSFPWHQRCSRQLTPDPPTSPLPRGVCTAGAPLRVCTAARPQLHGIRVYGAPG